MLKQSGKYQGSIREMIIIAFPMVVSHACDTVMTFTDRMFLSKLGVLQMSAAMAGGLSSFMMKAFFLGLTGYSTALVAQYFGSNQKDKCAVVTAQSLIISLLAYPLILSCKPLVLGLFMRSGIDTRQLYYQNQYFNIIIFTAVITLIRSSLSGFFCGIGRTKIVMQAAVVAMISNIIFNYILIFGKLGFPALGIRGAAIGTILGSFLGIMVLILSYFNKSNALEFCTRKSLAYSKQAMGKLLWFGCPSGIELFLNFSAFTAMMFLFHSEGAVAATATTIMINWDMVSFVPLLGVEIGVTSLVGRYMGAAKPDLANKATFSGLKLGSMYSAIIFVVFMIFPKYLVLWFQPSGANSIFIEAMPIAVFMLRVACLYVFMEAVIVTFVGALRGAGDTIWAMSLTVGLHIFVVLVEYVCIKVYRISIEITWIMIVISFFAGTFLIYLRYASGKWKRIKVVGAPGEAIQVDGFHEVE